MSRKYFEYRRFETAEKLVKILDGAPIEDVERFTDYQWDVAAMRAGVNPADKQTRTLTVTLLKNRHFLRSVRKNVAAKEVVA